MKVKNVIRGLQREYELQEINIIRRNKNLRRMGKNSKYISKNYFEKVKEGLAPRRCRFKPKIFQL